MKTGQIIAEAIRRLRHLAGGERGPSFRRGAGLAASAGAEAGGQVRILALASAAADRRQLEGFCRELGWEIVFLERSDDWSRVPWTGFTAIFTMGDPIADPLAAAFTLERGRSGSPSRSRPAVLVAEGKQALEELRPVARVFEHIEIKPLFLSTFKLLVTRARAGQFSAWPALPGGAESGGDGAQS